MRASPTEREKTDQSLRSERSRADQKLEDHLEEFEDDSDEVLALARERANEVLHAARAIADSQSMGSTPALRSERRFEDRALRAQHLTGDAVLSAEREERKRALAVLLRYEREETDKDLLTERSGADEALESRDEFLGYVSHDLRVLLGGISLTAALLIKESADDERGRKSIKRAQGIQRFTVQMNRMVNDLLDVVSIQAGKLAVAPVPGDLQSTIGETLDSFQPAARLQRISLCGPPSHPRCAILFDRERIQQVLANLLSNAFKFTSANGEVAVRVDRVGEEVRVSVRDSGRGVPADQLDAIFERFRQVEPRDRRGHGLGLYLSRKIIEAHGGRIWAESAEGEGTSVSFTLPCTDPPAGDPRDGRQ